MAKNKIDFLEQIELTVKDTAGEFIKTAVTSGEGIFDGENTVFTVNTNSGFEAGDSVYIHDGTANSGFTTVKAADGETTIILTGNFSAIQGGAVIKKTDAEIYLMHALALYSKYRPLERIERKIIPAPAKIFDLPSVSGYEWQRGFSDVNYIEYPAGNTPPLLLNEADFEIFLNDENVYKLRFGFEMENEYMLSYNVIHRFNELNPPVISAPESDFYCITDIASGIYLLALASRYSQNTGSLINADTVNYNSKPDVYRRLAKVHFGRAANWLGIKVSDLDGTDLEQSPASSNQLAVNFN